MVIAGKGVVKHHNKYGTFKSTFWKTFYILKHIVFQAKLTVQEQLLLQTKVQTLDDALCAHNLEAKASRETITRLMSEVGKEQKGISEVSNNVERLKRVSFNIYLILLRKAIFGINREMSYFFGFCSY